MPLYLTEADVAGLLDPDAAFAAVAASVERTARGEVDNRPRQRVGLDGGGVFAVMHAVDAGLGLAGLKSYAWLPGGTPFVVVLLSLERAEVEAVIEAERLGRLRTAAASAVAARLLRPEARTLGVIGCGRQAEAHVHALRGALPLADVVVHGRDRARVEAFCSLLGCRPAAGAGEAAEQDVVVTATTAREPVLRGEWLRPDALVLAIGANEPDARELDDAAIDRAGLVCTDSREEARLESGDLIAAVARGALGWADVRELHQLVGAAVPDGVVVFKSNGLAAWDVAAGAAVVAAARARGAGRELG